MCGCTRRWAAAGNSPRQPPNAHPTPTECHGHDFFRKNHTSRQPIHPRRPADADRWRPNAPLVAALHPVAGRGGAAGGGRRPLLLAKPAARQSRTGVCDRRGAPRQPHAQRVGQRHPAAHAGGDHWQRAVGYGQKRAGGRQRQGKKGAGAGRARHRQARCAGAALARLAGGCAGAAGAGGGHHQRGTGWLWPAARGGTPVGRQGAVGRRA